MFSLIGLLFPVLKKAFQPSIVSPIALVVSCTLQCFLLLGCINSSGTFSNMYVAAIPTNSTIVRASYFGLCEVANSTVTCVSLRNATSAMEDAYAISQHTVKPYFLILSTVVILMACALLAIDLFLSNRNNTTLPAIMSLVMLAVGWLFTVIAAIWQEVAAHAAVALISASKGQRASASIWAAVSFLSVSLALEVTSLIRTWFYPPNETDDEKQDIKKLNIVHQRV